jgi:hypothetical protein
VVFALKVVDGPPTFALRDAKEGVVADERSKNYSFAGDNSVSQAFLLLQCVVFLNNTPSLKKFICGDHYS